MAFLVHVGEDGIVRDIGGRVQGGIGAGILAGDGWESEPDQAA